MKKITVRVEGMVCGMCEAHVNDAVRRAFKVKKVSSSHSKGRTEIIAPEDIPDEELRPVIEGTGYGFVSAEHKEYVKRGLFS